MNEVSELTNEMLIAVLYKRVELESENEAEIIDHIREVMMRRIYLEFGADSMFDFLTRARYKYSRHIAMRKLDAARVMQSFPHIKRWIQTGEVNLSQLGMFQTALRQKPATLEVQAEVLEEIRNQTVENTQFILCEKLGLDIKKGTKVRIQRDGSRRVELSFSQPQWELMMEGKDILSHSVPSGDLAELISYCVKFTVDRKDPAAPLKKGKKKPATDPKVDRAMNSEVMSETISESRSDNRSEVRSGTTCELKSETSREVRSEISREVKPQENFAMNVSTKVAGDLRAPKRTADSSRKTSPPSLSTPMRGVPTRQRRRVSRTHRRIVFQRRDGCRHQYQDGSYCGSRYQLQVDHIISLWAGGTNDLKNLQVLCGVHNREKFRREIETWPPPAPSDP